MNCRRRNTRQLSADDRIPVLVSLPDAGLEHDKEPVMPRRVVAQVVVQHGFYKRELTAPQRIVVEVGEDPLPVRPGVVVLGVDLEGVGNEREFGCGVVRQLDQESTVVPDLIRFQVRDRELVHESQLGVQGDIQGNEGLVPILPDRRVVHVFEMVLRRRV